MRYIESLWRIMCPTIKPSRTNPVSGKLTGAATFFDLGAKALKACAEDARTTRAAMNFIVSFDVFYQSGILFVSMMENDRS
jgi:hypothetical protein